MNKIVTIIIVLLSFFSFSQKEIDSLFDFNTLDYSYAKAFLYDLEKESGLIVKNGNLNPTIVDSVGVRLDSAQATKVIQVITGGSDGLEDERNMCFIPHHGIVFYDENDQVIAHISICFYCGTKYIYPKTIKTERGMNILADIIKELGFPIFDGPQEYAQYGAELRAKGVKN